MKLVIAASTLALLASASLASAQTTTSPSTMPSTTAPHAASTVGSTTSVLASVPSGSTTVTNWYKQNVYGPDGRTSVGQVKDVLVDADGKVTAFIVGVGGFLGMGDHDVAVPFSEIKHAMQDNKSVLTMEASKDALKTAPGLRYDSATTTWVPEAK